MKTNAVNVAAFLRGDTERAILCHAAEIRRKALDACYLIPGYCDLPREERNAIYDRVKTLLIENEMKGSI